MHETPIEKTRAFFEKQGQNMTEEELIAIRDVTDELANLIVRGYWDKHKQKKKAEAQEVDKTTENDQKAPH